MEVSQAGKADGAWAEWERKPYREWPSSKAPTQEGETEMGKNVSKEESQKPRGKARDDLVCLKNKQWDLWFWSRVSEGEGKDFEERMTDYTEFCKEWTELNSTLVIGLSEPIKPQEHPLHFQHRGLESLSVKQKILHEDSGLSTELQEQSHCD